MPINCLRIGLELEVATIAMATAVVCPWREASAAAPGQAGSSGAKSAVPGPTSPSSVNAPRFSDKRIAVRFTECLIRGFA